MRGASSSAATPAEDVLDVRPPARDHAEAVAAVVLDADRPREARGERVPDRHAVVDDPGGELARAREDDARRVLEPRVVLHVPVGRVREHRPQRVFPGLHKGVRNADEVADVGIDAEIVRADALDDAQDSRGRVEERPLVHLERDAEPEGTSVRGDLSDPVDRELPRRLVARVVRRVDHPERRRALLGRERPVEPDAHDRSAERRGGLHAAEREREVRLAVVRIDDAAPDDGDAGEPTPAAAMAAASSRSSPRPARPGASHESTRSIASNPSAQLRQLGRPRAPSSRTGRSRRRTARTSVEAAIVGMRDTGSSSGAGKRDAEGERQRVCLRSLRVPRASRIPPAILR